VVVLVVVVVMLAVLICWRFKVVADEDAAAGCIRILTKL
jgi:hypothetical protein